MRWWWIGFLSILLLLSIDIVQSAEKLPITVASHFNAAGVVDGRMSRATHIVLMVFTMNFVAIIAPGLIALISKLPQDLLNLPNKEYWLRIDQRLKTFEFLKKWGILMGSATAIFIWHLHYKLVVANQLQPPMLENFGLSLVVFLAYTLLMIVALYRRFRLPANSSPQP